MSRNPELKLFCQNLVIITGLSLACTSAHAYLDAESLEYEKQRDDAAVISDKSAQTPSTTSKAATNVSADSATDSAKTTESVGITDATNTNNENSTKQLDASSSDSDKEYSDPYEKYNRFMYAVNKKIDKYIIKPPAQLYAWLMPLPVKYMVTNFFENIQDLQVLANDLLQGEVGTGTETLGRIVLNSTFGMFGLIDVAKDVGVHRRTNDFGITFGKWGMTESSYFVIPIIGPSTVRDTVGTGVAIVTNPIYYYLPDEYSWGLTGLYMIDKRANLLSLEKIIDTVSDDEYVFVRNSYFAYRDALIRGEKPNVEQETHEQELIENIIDQDTTINGSLEELPSLDEPAQDKPAQDKSAAGEASKVSDESQATTNIQPQTVVPPNVDAKKLPELAPTDNKN